MRTTIEKINEKLSANYMTLEQAIAEFPAFRKCYNAFKEVMEKDNAYNSMMLLIIRQSIEKTPNLNEMDAMYILRHPVEIVTR